MDVFILEISSSSSLYFVLWYVVRATYVFPAFLDSLASIRMMLHFYYIVNSIFYICTCFFSLHVYVQITYVLNLLCICKLAWI